MTILERFLFGEMEIKEFLVYLKENVDLQNEIRNLIPEDAKDNYSHALWKNISISPYRDVSNYDLFEFISKRNKFNLSLGDNLNIFGTLSMFYQFYYPDFPFTTKYSDYYNLYLHVAGDYFEGPEVNARIEQIISEYYAIKPKTKQRKLARERIRQEFHIVGNKYPHWIQSPEWPMGEKSPMMYVSRSKGKDPDAVEFHFMDVDTGETRTIEQFY